MSTALKPTALVVDDEAIARKNLALVLTRQGLTVEQAANGAEALAALEHNEFDLVITDLMMTGVSGMDVLQRTKELWPATEVLMVTGYPTIETAVEAMRRGAYHYLVKPYQIDEVRALVDKALEKRRLRQEVQELRQRLRQANEIPFLGEAPSIRQLKRTLEHVAPTDSTVLILGETGTGKELVARTIHLLSRRAQQRFLAINCGAFTEDLLENELFGHEAGAYSGAQRPHKGLFEAAHGGTLFLDEVGEMSPSMQVKLLRALQERTIRRVGGTDDIPVDVRIIAATNRDLQREVAHGTFRQDLYFRLNVITLEVPPLSERREDIPLLSHFFLAKAARRLGKEGLCLAPETLEILHRYPFPGNVRELENIMERAAVLAEGTTILPRHLPPDLSAVQGHVQRPCHQQLITLEENERLHIAWVLRHCQGNRTQAAKILGIDRASLWRKLKRYAMADALDDKDSSADA
ncbi:sigma-54-dependent Fis family transcriptional regulator [Thermodesulfomicrobium sp. WS]|uniref:sigma-54-dependent transcriptional regulator n=1 Tax=Thermodesulfomicrobium sp. WS TaxID=3004129 RepID=UPI002492856A|nr:sigma-54 dependent transcriptional regulator [Thermodesulfomicrobium sp. WS]BDV00196.1 sigma-54-dependent Fis family transcriptional regulator [Thermodesulfomicrobium sp. WS]